MNQNQTFDLDEPIIPKYIKLDKIAKQKYIQEVFSKVKYDYELEITPSLSKLKEYVQQAFERFEDRRKKIGFTSESIILLKLTDDLFVKIPSNG